MVDKTSEMTKHRRRLALGYLMEARGSIVPMQVFLGLFGDSTNKCRVTKELIDPLREVGHDIVSLHGAAGGYRLIISNDRIISEIAELKALVVSLNNRNTSPIPGNSVPGNSITGNVLPGNLVPGNGAGKTGVGRPKVTAPTDTAPLVAAIMAAYIAGQPFTKTGTRGLYARRAELPEEFSVIARNRIEDVVAGLLKSGTITQDVGGVLSVPKKVPGN